MIASAAIYVARYVFGFNTYEFSELTIADHLAKSISALVITKHVTTLKGNSGSVDSIFYLLSGLILGQPPGFSNRICLPAAASCCTTVTTSSVRQADNRSNRIVRWR